MSYQQINKLDLCVNNSGSDIKKLFFSKANIKRIQQMIKKEVSIRTDGKYNLEADQKESDLLVVMQLVFQSEDRNLPTKIVKQVKILNNKLIEFIIEGIICNIKQYYAYIKEINEPLKPIARPVNINKSGRKVLPSMTSIWENC